MNVGGEHVHKKQSDSSDSMAGETVAICFTHQSTERWRWDMTGGGGIGGDGIRDWCQR